MRSGCFRIPWEARPGILNGNGLKYFFVGCSGGDLLLSRKRACN
jgi:hypothetical protein